MLDAQYSIFVSCGIRKIKFYFSSRNCNPKSLMKSKLKRSVVFQSDTSII